jgi:hypothetical protein
MIKINKTILLICIIVTSPFAALCCMALLNCINPMQLAFLTSFKVENQSGQDIWVTPIGTIGAEGRKSRLPIFITVIPAFHAIKTGRFHLKDGETLKIKYDWDDINFSEIAVEAKGGQFYQSIVDPKPTENRYHPPRSRHFIIPELETLPSIQPTVLEATNQPDRMRTLPLFTFGSIALLIIYLRMIVHYRKEKVGISVASANVER